MNSQELDKLKEMEDIDMVKVNEVSMTQPSPSLYGLKYTPTTRTRNRAVSNDGNYEANEEIISPKDVEPVPTFALFVQSSETCENAVSPQLMDYITDETYGSRWISFSWVLPSTITVALLAGGMVGAPWLGGRDIEHDHQVTLTLWRRLASLGTFIYEESWSSYCYSEGAANDSVCNWIVYAQGATILACVLGGISAIIAAGLRLDATGRKPRYLCLFSLLECFLTASVCALWKFHAIRTPSEEYGETIPYTYQLSIYLAFCSSIISFIIGLFAWYCWSHIKSKMVLHIDCSNNRTPNTTFTSLPSTVATIPIETTDTDELNAI